MARAANRNVIRTIYKLMEEGKSTTEIGDLLGMSQPAVSELAQKKHLRMAMEMMALADEGQTLEQIGKQYGLSKQRVQQLIGKQAVIGSTGKTVTINAAPESWSFLLDTIDGLDIPVRYKETGTDTRAIAALFDGLREGEYRIVRRRGRTPELV